MDETGNSLSGKRILITRAVEQSESIVKVLRDNGAIPVPLPMVAFAPPDDPALLDQSLQALGRFDWIFLTSQNSLRAMQDRCAVIGLPLAEAIAEVKIAAVGPATAEAARNAGLEVTYVAKKHQGVALAEELSALVKGKAVLLPRSDRANKDLVVALGTFGAAVKEVVAYKTIRPTEDENKKHLAEIKKGADAILFFSPSAVLHMQDLLGGARFVILSNSVAFTAVGPVTAKALRKAAVQKMVVSAGVHATAVVSALTEYFSGTREGLPAGAK